MRQAAQNRLLNFCQIINSDYEAIWYHEKIAESLEKALQNTVEGKKTRIILSVPPRSGKSQLASIYFPAWALGKYPTLKFILATYGAELSEEIGMKTRDVITNETYTNIFPEIALKADTKSKAKWMTNKGGSYTAVGVGGAITGKGGNIIVIDDIHKDRAEAESETARKTVWDYYRSTLYSRLEGFGTIIVIMQRWSQMDLVGLLLEEEEKIKKENPANAENWEVISFPAIAEEDEYFKGKLVRKEGEALWPSRYPVEFLNLIRQQSPVFWASQYQQDPILSEAQEFKKEMFRYFEEKDLEQKYLRYYTLIDPAISQKASGDNTVVLTVAKEVSGPNFYRIKEDAGHFTPGQTVDIILEHQKKYRSDVWIETVAYQQALKFMLEEERRKRQQYFVIQELKASSKKEERIRGLLGLYQMGVIWHRPTADIDYEYELMAFPRGRRDDRCPIGKTLIQTDKGNVPIKYVKPGDYVLTSAGYKKVLVAGKTGKEKVITNIGISATPDHPIHTERGWVSLASLEENDIITVCEKQLHGMGLSLEDILTLKKGTTEFIGKEELKEVSPIYTEKYGKKKMVQSLKDFIYTTLTKIQTTTRLLIFKLLVLLSIHKYIYWTKKELADQNNGMNQTLEKHGEKQNQDECQKKQPQTFVVLIVKKILKMFQRIHSFFVACIAKIYLIKENLGDRLKKTKKKNENNILKRLIKQFTAKTAKWSYAMRHGENTIFAIRAKKKEDIKYDISKEKKHTLQETAQSVEQPLLFKIKVGTLNSVLKNANIKELCVDSGSVENVYNLQVEGKHEYFANGVLVHNCDTMAYILQAAVNTTDSNGIKQFKPKWLSYGRKK